MSEKVSNTFNEGFNMDASDFVLPDSQLRYAQNVRLVNLEGSNYVLTNLKGTNTKFTLTSGFKPVATQEYNSILYIISYNQSTTEIEIGSYPSPDYSNPSSGNIWVYRPFNNLIGGPDGYKFRTILYELESKPVIQKLEIQQDYDQSVNLCFTIEGKKPKIVNSKFKANISGGNIEIVTTRVGLASTNEYSLSSLVDETNLILATDKILKIAYGELSSGGKVKPGNYIYAFKYMSEDLNKTSVVGQSSVCQVAFGSNESSKRGGNETEQTNFRVSLNLSNLDTNFKYLKAYVLYSAGQDALYQQYLEFSNPIEITGESMTFIHDGYEQLQEVTSAELNLDYATVDSAGCSVQVGGFYFLADITQNKTDFTEYKNFAAGLTPVLGVKELVITTNSGYNNPANVYNYLGGMGGESYPYGIIFLLKNGGISPVFPTKGRTFINSTVADGGVAHGNDADDFGIVTYPDSHKLPFIKKSGGADVLNVRYLKFTMTIPEEIRNNSVGFFFVRGERRTDLLQQGIMIPTMKTPPVDYLTSDDSLNVSYFNDKVDEIDNTLFFKHLPCIDSLQEAYLMIRRNDGATFGSGDKEVIDEFNKIKDGYMPIYINDMATIPTSPVTEIWYSKSTETWARHWAFISGDGIVSEPDSITQLHGKKACGLKQIAKMKNLVKGQLPSIYTWRGFSASNTGLFYDFNEYEFYSSNENVRTVKSISYVNSGTFETGSDFISKIKCSFWGGKDGSDPLFFFVHQLYNPFFGIEMETGATGQLLDSTKGLTNPIGSNGAGATSRITAARYVNDDNSEVSGTTYNNYGTVVPAGFLVNLYESPTRATPNQLYKTTNNIVYKQVGQRYSWSEVPNGTVIEVFGGDCYISKIYRKLNYSPYTNPLDLAGEDLELRGNINSGIMVSWYQESKHNLYLRQPKIYDLNEPGERTFYPYVGDFNKFRENRLPETTAYSLGYSEKLTPKDFFQISSLTPYVENNYLTRVMHSSRHVPNAFKNAYRSFLPTALKDYNSSMGRIKAMFDHRGSLLIVFEHGVGITSIEQRVETASDVAGAIFIQPSEILPQQLQYFSKEIGCQTKGAMVQTPSAVYGFDESRNIIWQVRDNLQAVSDAGFASFLQINGIVNPRCGYDPQYKEVIFTTDNWTLCFKEGLEKFTSFYSFKPDFYSRRVNEMYSFLNNTAWVHNEPVYTIYTEQKDSIVEFVVNKNLDVAKVLDYIQLVSNEIRPSKIEVFTYDDENVKGLTLNPAGTHQYVKIESGIDPITEEEIIEYRDKHFSVQIPEITNYSSSVSDDEWGIDDRMRNKYFIIRVTYNTDKPLELASVISTFRYSRS